MIIKQPKINEYLASREAEQQIIGIIMVDPKLSDDIMALVAESDFFYEDTREMFNLIAQAKREGKDFGIVDLSIMREKLESTGDVTLAYAAELYNNCQSTKMFETYSAAIKERALKRELVRSLYTIKSNLESPKPFNECAGNAHSLMLSVGEENASHGVVQVNSLLDDFKKTLTARVNKEAGAAGLSTGLNALDRLFAGMRGSTMTVLAARPSEGKTTLAMNICEAVCETGVPALFFSIEMANSELIERLAASLGGVPSEAMRHGDIEHYNKQLTRGLQRIEQLPLYVCSEEKITADRIRSIARMYKRVYNIGLIVIDYIGIVDIPKEKYARSRTESVGQVSRAFKMMAKELDIPVLALCQLNRDLDKADRDPRLSDLRDSGEIEQDADVIAFLARTPDEGISKVTVAKHRHSAIGHCFLKLNGSISRFEDTNHMPLHSQVATFGDRYGLTSKK